MPFVIIILCLAAPLIELTVLIKVGQAIGFWTTLLLVVGMAALGAFLLHRQGWSTMQRAQSALTRGEAPVGPMLDGMMLGFAGFLFLVPGLVSDAFGLLLLIPPLRRALARRMLKHFFVVTSGDMTAGAAPDRPRRGDGGGPGPVIDGEFERLDERPVRSTSAQPRSDRSTL